MLKEKLIETLKRVLNTENDLSFLLQLSKSEIETLLACVRAELNR